MTMATGPKTPVGDFGVIESPPINAPFMNQPLADLAAPRRDLAPRTVPRATSPRHGCDERR